MFTGTKPGRFGRWHRRGRQLRCPFVPSYRGTLLFTSEPWIWCSGCGFMHELAAPPAPPRRNR